MEENKPIEQLNKKERRELKHHQKSERRESAIRMQKIKRYIAWGSTVLVAIVLVGGITLAYKNKPKIPESDIVSRDGLHWHPTPLIYVKGEKQDLPLNLGISPSGMTPVHTHDDANQGIIHLEFQGLVHKSDITLGQFFKNWGKDIRSFGTSMKMRVNGKENTEPENYVMQDKDSIELKYE
jgi:hypothetical protein